MGLARKRAAERVKLTVGYGQQESVSSDSEPNPSSGAGGNTGATSSGTTGQSGH